jgi:hypothetical protein
MGSCSAGAGFTPAPPMSAGMELNEFGVIARDEWLKLPVRYSNIKLDAFQIMPSHIHGIIFIRTGDAQTNAGETLAVDPLTGVRAGALCETGPTIRQLILQHFINPCFRHFKTYFHVMAD